MTIFSMFLSNFEVICFFIVIIGLIILKIKFPQLKGAIGEKFVSHRLKKLDSNYKVYHDLYVPNKKGTTQIDHVVTSPYGIFVIETKHYNGWIFGSENQKYWTQVIYKRKEKLYNPIWQNYGHIQSLKRENSPFFYSIIAFSNQSTLKFNENFTSAKVIQIPQLVNVIKEKNNVVFNPMELQEINDLLEKLNDKSRKEKRAIKKGHVQQVKSNLQKQKVMDGNIRLNNTCPKCNGKLSIRNEKYGSFYGCSNFPKCKYTKKIS